MCTKEGKWLGRILRDMNSQVPRNGACSFVQAERELRAKLDNAFDSFRKKVESLPQSHLTFEVPFRELG